MVTLQSTQVPYDALFFLFPAVAQAPVEDRKVLQFQCLFIQINFVNVEPFHTRIYFNYNVFKNWNNSFCYDVISFGDFFMIISMVGLEKKA